MGKYENEKFLENMIIEDDYHQFVYGYNNEQRSEFLKKLVINYPVLFDTDRNIVLYTDRFLPIKDFANTRLLSSLAYEYFGLDAASKIIARTLENKELDYSRLDEVIRNNFETNTLEETLKELEISKQSYYDSYINEKDNKSGIKITSVELIPFIQAYKEAVNNSGNFTLIVDKKREISSFSARAVNSYVAVRKNRDLSIKVALDPVEEMWPARTDTFGNRIDYVDDYTSIELDDSAKQYRNKRMASMHIIQ